MLKLQDKWGKHVFNINHPAYTDQIWTTLITSVRRLMESITEPLTGFDKSIIKRQLYHMMFLEEDAKNPFETIAYNDSEHLDEYNGYTGMLVKFNNSGLATSANMSFNEFLQLPNWLADWALNWSLKQSASQNEDTEDALQSMEAQMKKEAERTKKNIPFSGNY